MVNLSNTSDKDIVKYNGGFHFPIIKIVIITLLLLVSINIGVGCADAAIETLVPEMGAVSPYNPTGIVLSETNLSEVLQDFKLTEDILIKILSGDTESDSLANKMDDLIFILSCLTLLLGVGILVVISSVVILVLHRRKHS